VFGPSAKALAQGTARARGMVGSKAAIRGQVSGLGMFQAFSVNLLGALALEWIAMYAVCIGTYNPQVACVGAHMVNTGTRPIHLQSPSFPEMYRAASPNRMELGLCALLTRLRHLAVARSRERGHMPHFPD